MVWLLFPTVAVTRIPPVVMVFVPASVRVKAPAVLKRRLLIVKVAGDWLDVRSTSLVAVVKSLVAKVVRPVMAPATVPVPALTAHVVGTVAP